MSTRIAFKHYIKPATATLVGADDAVAVSKFTNSAKIELPGPMSGDIVSVTLVSTETGTGAVQSVTGDLLFLSADPDVSAGDADLTAAEWKTVIGRIPVTSDKWVSKTAGAVWFDEVLVPFEELDGLWAVFIMDSGSSMNSAAGDDEILELQVRVESA